MKIFLSWSGKRARSAAEAMRGWLKNIMPDVDPWLSEDIEAGSRWNNAIRENLEQAAFGILFVDQSSLASPWLLFEAGAMATRFSGSQGHTTAGDRLVCPYLLDLTPEDLCGGPLEQFQAKIANETGTYDLLKTINRLRGSDSIGDDELKIQVHERWPDLQRCISRPPIKELWLVGTSLVHTADHGYPDLKKRLGEGCTINVLLPDPNHKTAILAASHRSSKGKSPDDKRREICATLNRLCLLQREAAHCNSSASGSSQGGKLEIRTTRHALGYGVDGTNSNGALDIKLYPTAVYKGHKPHFVLRPGDPQHASLEQEVRDLWDKGTVWSCQTNCKDE